MNRNLYRKEKKRLNLPPLGWKDICLYLLGILLSVGLLLGVFLALFQFEDQVCALVAPGALGRSDSANLLISIAAIFLPTALGTISLERMEQRYPIFGNPGYTYGGGSWDPVYPAMLRDENAPPEVQKSVKDARFGLSLWGLGLALSVVLGVFAIVGGTWLYPDGSIETTVGFGEVTKCVSAEQIDRVILNVREPGRREHRWKLELTFRTEDNKLIAFSVHDLVTGEGESEVDVLRRIFACYPEEKLRFENADMLDRVFWWCDYDQEDQRYLEELFGVS